MFFTSIARIATRPSYDVKEGLSLDNISPDLAMMSLFKSGAHLLKSDHIYELGMNELTGVIELREMGKSNIGKGWNHNFYDITTYLGNKTWLTEDEYSEYLKTS